ncbi:MAG TPA: PQQ-binding-like beta-propeller repeat protein [Roseimicrobium sp.]|nr:PQQ-binding-like beta-propeller repeat protein [Roseimicrobium sp.]
MMNRRIALFVLLLGLLSLPLSTFAADWPRFLGPDANGTSKETGLLDAWPKSGPSNVWDKAIGTGYGAPSVMGNRLVFHHRVADKEIVECVEAITGKSIWSYGYPSSYVDPYGYNNGPRCAPLLTTNLCYTFGAQGKLLCLELATGKKAWERDTAKEWTIPEAFFGVGSTPLLEGNVLIVMVGGQPNSGVVGLDPATGKTLWENVGKSNWQGQPMIGWPGERTVDWKAYDKQASYSSPVAATIHGQRHVFCLMRQGLVSLNPANGTVNFSRFFQATVNDSVNAMNPVVVDDMVLISAAYYRVGAVVLKVNPDGKSFTEVWKTPAGGREFDSVSGRPIPPTLEIHWSTPIYHAGHVYAFSGRNEPDATFRCVEYKTGQVKWSYNQRWAPHSSPQPNVYGRGSAILADGKIIVVGEGGLLGLFKPNAERADEISRYQVPQLHHPCWAAPVLSNKKLYLRSEDHLVCLDLAAK